MDSTITSKGQIVIPARFRKQLGFAPGNKVHFDEQEGKLVLTLANREIIDRLRGSLSVDVLSELEALRKVERETGRF